MVLLVMAGLWVNLGPPVEQKKTNQTLNLGPYHRKNCTWLPTTCCADIYRHRQLHGTWGSLHNSSQSAAALYNSTATPTVTRLSEYLCPLLAPVGALWYVCDLWHGLHTWTCIKAQQKGPNMLHFCVLCGDMQVGNCDKTVWQHHKDRKKPAAEAGSEYG